ncbi:hypothetical protein [Streptomyces eurythermus]|uniref:hypothetical protein n=1 Tax=Streptomyces eurythermus TaxID=42237 RepID=UPI00370022F6
MLAPLTLTRPAASPAGDATPTTNTAGGRPVGEEEELPAGLLESHPTVRALDCLIDYAAGHATTDGAMPGHVLDLLVGVLASRGSNEAVAAGTHLPLHRRAIAFTAAHHRELP